MERIDVNERVIGRRVAAARCDAGFTQAQCAERSGLDRSALAQAETGRRSLNATELVRLASVLDMRLEWFFQEVPKAVSSRRNAAKPRAASSRIDRFTERLARESEFLMRLGTLDVSATPEITVPVTTERAEAAAAEARAILGYDAWEPAAELGGRVARVCLLAFSWEFDGDAADGAFLRLDRSGVAVVNGSLQSGRRQLALAHQLGHYLFADEYSTECRTVSASAENREGLIDRFARALLLPMNVLADRWRNGDKTRISALRIANEYRVGLDTLAQRLTELGMASPEAAARVGSIRPRRNDITELGLLATDELAPPTLPDVYIRTVLEAYHNEEISAARASGLLLDTREEADLPSSPSQQPDAIRSLDAIDAFAA